jgi:hypothetical protein
MNNLDRAVRSFRDEYGVDLFVTNDVRNETKYTHDGERDGSVLLEDIYATHFEFSTHGVKVSGRLPKNTYMATYIAEGGFEGDVTEDEMTGVAIAIYKVCGPINYGEDCTIGEMMG